MKQVHNVRVRVVDREKQVIEQVIRSVLTLSEIPVEQASITYSTDGESEDPLFIGELWLDRQPAVRKAIAMLTQNLPLEQRNHITEHPEQFIDMATHCFLRLDKAALLDKQITFGREQTVQVRLNIAAFPATKANAVPILTTLFSTG